MIELFKFQEEAAANVAARVSEYLDQPQIQIVDRRKHVVPFFHALAAVTGAGKTAILAESVAQMASTMPVKPIVVWLSKGKVVVQQSFANLAPGGKYHHLLDGMNVELLADYSEFDVAEAASALVYFATVGTFNQKDKQDGSLLIHKSDVDNMERSIWDALKVRTDSAGNRRPLIVVYDEAQNLSDQQTDLLLELEPDGFLMASATMRLPARIGEEVARIRTAGYGDSHLVTQVKTSDVVSEGLIKDTVLLEGYNSPMEEAVGKLLSDLNDATIEADSLGLDFRPKSMYVCNTNVIADTPNLLDDPRQPFEARQAPPILIWRFLVEQNGVDPSEVAVYSDLKTHKDFPLPSEFNLFRGAEQDYDEFSSQGFRHIIFNLSLQEGWDDPSVYFAYIDKSMGSPVQVTQTIGRVLRQPNATHYPAARLNAAHFYVRVDRNAVFNEVITEVQTKLGTVAEGVKFLISSPGKPKSVEFAPKVKLTVPEVSIISDRSRARVVRLMSDFPDYRHDAINTKGTGSRRVLRQVVGDSGTAGEWEEYYYSAEASARWIFYRELKKQNKFAIGVADLNDPKLDAIVGIGSPAHKHVMELSSSVVEEYINGAHLKQRKHNPFVVGSELARPDEVVTFRNAAHDGYSGLNSLELEFAVALDNGGFIWSRNSPRVGYGIPLVTVGPTSYFFPDFLLWTEARVVCIDTKGPHLVDSTARRKLLTVRAGELTPRLDIQFVSEGKYDRSLSRRSGDGFSLWSLAEDGSLKVSHHDELDTLLSDITDDTLHS